MNHTALTLNNVKRAVPRVWSLHGPDGETKVVYANDDPHRAALEIARWIPVFRQGWVAIEWRSGEPFETISWPTPP